MKKPELTKFKEIVQLKAGNISEAAKGLKISRQTFHTWIKEDAEFKQAYEGCLESSIDAAESQLFKLIEQGNITAIIFFLKTRAKKRGYVERSEVEQVQRISFIDDLR